MAAVAATGVAVAAAAAAGASRMSVPSNLCTLKLKTQLEAIGVASKCKEAKTAKVGALTIEGANWGAIDNSIGVQVYMGAPKSRFKAQFGQVGSPVALGSFAREASGPSGVSLAAWVSGVGLVVNFNHPADAAKNKTYAAGVLALAKAAAKQL
jgi:hypothetical protein